MARPPEGVVKQTRRNVGPDRHPARCGYMPL